MLKKLIQIFKNITTTNVGSGYIKLRKCEICNNKFYANSNDRSRGWGKFCSRNCANKAQSKNFGKENAKRSFNKKEGKWDRYWRDEATGKKMRQSESRWNWEINNGDIHEGLCVSFKDRDKTNSSIENLELVTRRTLQDRLITNYKMIDEVEYKLCGRCNDWLTTDNYTTHYKDRFHSYCKKCLNEYRRNKRKDKK